ncbi:hypothetical protein HK100_001546 [Physocladia obscura]|uniref:GH26 domain-containing protein n=1 Tax=Physocladia obscura TaxID=109957 RepID=A0AAD5T8Y1_9FUNG|nr:hypothetical protein HK100_001546 [Physocladia obscura]
MHLMLGSILLFTTGTFINAAAPLEPADGKLLLGAWYDRNNSDSPAAINARFDYKPLSFFQTDIDLSGTVKPQASEMNGSWFQYGQDPLGFIAAWIRCITYWRKALGSNSIKVAFIWSPNSGNGYPYPGDPYSFNVSDTSPENLANFQALDTNNNGQLDPEDDPYLPYYPGDEYVDWVGLSIYHYGSEYSDLYHGWDNNVIPLSGKFENYLNGDPNDPLTYGYAPFYTYFASSTGCKTRNGTAVSIGNKPLVISETAATYHFAWIDPTDKPPIPGNATRLEIKQAWWTQFLNTEFLAKYPQMKAVSTFEFIKWEEATWRDFTVFGPAPDPDPTSPDFTTDDTDVVVALADYVKNLSFISFANTVNESISIASVTATKSEARSGTLGPYLIFFFVSFFLFL